MTAQKITPSLSGDVLVIRDRGETDSYIPAEAVPETGEADVPPDRVITGSYAEAVSHRTSFRLDAETGNDPVETLPSLRSDTDYASQAAPPRVIGQLERIPADYDYASPVPEGEPQTREYFSDAVLVGDSRMQGLILYCGLSQVTSYTYKGLTVDSVFTRPVIEWEEDEDLPENERIPEELWDEGKVPVMEALKQTEYSKVYIMLGINETGWPDPEYFPKAYGKVIDAVREDNPQCLIYILSVFPVTQAVSDYHDYVTNDKIALYNQYLQQLAYEKEVFLVDLAPAVVDGDGVLPADSGVDGIHLNKTYCTRVLDHILSHTVPLLTDEEVLAAEEAETAGQTT
ncbi:MAG: hypothetical protein IJX14_06235 [Clostridia bacterium]|nr:hypothetical protein [Clostridia bacterium]